MKKIILGSGAKLLADLAIFIILGLTPLFLNYFYPTSIDLSKIVLFKIFVLLLLFAVVWHLARFKIIFNKNCWKDLIPVVSLFVFLGFSLLVSVDINNSWFGSYNRQEGLISWLFYGLWMILLVLRLNSETKENRLTKINYFLKITSFSGLLVSLYAVFQIFGLDFFTWSEPASITGRAVSSFGQPNYLACWLVLVLPFSAYLFSVTKNKINRLIWGSIFTVELSALLATGSRAAFLVFLIISIFWFFWFLFQRKILSFKKILLIIISSLVVFLIFIVFIASINKDRFTELTDFKKGSAAVRLDLWQKGLVAYSKKPILGYGLENQMEAYIGYYKVDDALYSRPNVYSDRAHNLILDILLTSGIVGLIFFIYFLYWIFSNLFTGLKNNNYHNLSAFLIWSLIVYLVSLLFNFSVTITNIYFWLIVSLSIIVTEKEIFLAKVDEKSFSLAKIIFILGALIIFFYGSFVEIEKIEADYYYYNIFPEIAHSEYFPALVLKDYVDETHPNPVFSDYYNREISLTLVESLSTINNKSSIFTVSRYLETTEKLLASNNFENKFVKAFILGTLGNRVESEKIFNNLIVISPEMPKIYLAWGDSLAVNHDYKNAIIKFEKAFSLLPDSNNPYLNKEQLYRLNNYKQQITNRINVVSLLVK
jgi:O-antigen ligase